ncbi:MAG: hypothetical protein GKS06_14100 [Acidobacteria bacterium]|nr:hypothetical protein [Acidobacteriota bacterium]
MVAETSRQSSPDTTPRTRALLDAALSEISDAATVVDLGAGRDAGVARAIRTARPRARVFAVEPNVPVETTPDDRIEVIAGDLADVPADIPIDAILFNSPNTADRFVDRSDGSWHQFAGGPDGHDCLHGVVATSLARLGDNGQVIFICPTFSPPPPAARLRLLGTYAEPRAPFLARAPVQAALRAEYEDWIAARLASFETAWQRLGVEPTSDSIIAAVLSARGAIC